MIRIHDGSTIELNEANSHDEATMKSVARFIIYSLLVTALSSNAAPHFRQAKSKKVGGYLTDGVFVGGQNLIEGTSLLNIRRHFSKKSKVERVVLDIGDYFGRPLVGKLGYFHIRINKKQRKIFIELTDLKKVKLPKDRFVRLVSASPVVQEMNYHFDAVDHTFVLEFSLNKSVALEVFKMPSNHKAGRIVLDMKVL